MKKKSTFRLDAFDHQLLEALRVNARATNRALAKLVGLSTSATLARQRKLERLGIIRGYTIVLAPDDARGVQNSYLVEVELDDLRPAHLRNFETLLHSNSAVISIARTSGQFDYLIQLDSRSPNDWTQFAKAAIDIGVSIRRTRITTIVETLKAPAISAACVTCRQTGQAGGETPTSLASCD